MDERREPSVMLTHSARSWARPLHFHLVDHGGALMLGYALSEEDVVSSRPDVLVLDDVCSFLSRRLVRELTRVNVKVIGVFDPADGSAGRDHLADLGVDTVLGSDTSPERFLAAITAGRSIGARLPLRDDEPIATVSGRHGRVLAIGAANAGAGATEVALALALDLSRRDDVTLIDADGVTPSVAQRLGLPPYPNLRSAGAAVRDGVSSLDEVARNFPGTGLRIVAGTANPTLWRDIRPPDVAAVMSAAAARSREVVVDVGAHIEDLVAEGGYPRHGVSRQVLCSADAVVLVVTPSPVGVARFAEWMATAHRLIEGTPLHLVMNRLPRGGYRSGEVRRELDRFASPRSITVVPADLRVERAAWLGRPVARGPFRRRVRGVAKALRAGAPQR